MEENKDIPPKELSQNIPDVEQRKMPATVEKATSREENILHELEQSQIPPSSETEAVATNTINPTQIENMEVHHHGHVHEKKKWKEYVFQFLMLFLAVFCGFLAEYQLEHVIENSREKNTSHP